MNDLSQENDESRSEISPNAHLLENGAEVLVPLADAFDEIGEAIERLVDSSDPNISDRAASLGEKLEKFEPSVTLVGQVKSGKTALTNVLAGRLDLLPSDVNPWTSVVTTLHLSPKVSEDRTKAKFTFFDREEWSSLIATGGRLGELANRAGADDEMEKIQAQLEMMREQSRKRLGNSFEALLGQTHKYGYYDNELIERYVCMGEDEEWQDDPKNKQGRFADITQSAELNIHLPELAVPISLRDTPGVNDTFMVREQITLKNLRGSEICLVVLSAHQALNTTDMALVRMISNFEKRQIILFVNRIDELPNPSKQVPEIRESIIATLKANNAPYNCEIIFGSAMWAAAGLRGDMSELDSESQSSMLDWAQALGQLDTPDVNEHIWILSGMPELMRAINNRILEGAGKRLLDTVRTQLANLSSEVKAQKSIVGPGSTAKPMSEAERVQLTATLDKLLAENQQELSNTTSKLLGELKPRLVGAQNSFVRRATDALISHLERHGEQETWQYESTGLRLLLRSAYARFGVATKKQVGAVYNKAASEIEAIYVEKLGVNVADFKIEAPIVPTFPPPVVLGKTIALDLTSNWWRRWWQKRKGFESFANDYSSLIQMEVSSIIEDLEKTQIVDIFSLIDDTLHIFLQEQRDSILKMSGALTGQPADELPDSATQQAGDVEVALDDALAVLERLAS